jgi:tryptophan synthase alpha chain
MESASATTLSDRIERRFETLRNSARKALVCYVTAGHPDPGASALLLKGLPQAGADIIELGIPFSDPLADGPVIQKSSQIALGHGFNFERSLALVREVKSPVPIVIMSYLNPVIAGGPDALERAGAAGVDGILITDLPVGADAARERWLGSGPLAFVRLVAPTTPLERMREIARNGRGFVYLISRLGVTGEQDRIAAELPQSVARLREATDLPICVGFGISTPAQAREVAKVADGIVVGSAIVRAAQEDGVDAALDLVARMRAALDANQ